MRLRPAVTAKRAIQAIEERISAAQRPLNETSSADVKRDSYLNWVYETKVQLQAIFSDAVPGWAGFRMERLNCGSWKCPVTSAKYVSW